MAQKEKTSVFKIIKLKYLSEITGIDYAKIYNVLVLGIYGTLTDNDRTKMSNALYQEVKKIFRAFGFNITIERIK